MKSLLRLLQTIILPTLLQGVHGFHIYESLKELTLQDSLIIMYEVISLSLLFIEIARDRNMIDPLTESKHLLTYLGWLYIILTVAVNVYAFLHTHWERSDKIEIAFLIAIITVMFEMLIKIVACIKRRQ